MARSSLRFAGYAGLFDVADGAQDTIRQGAFKKTLAARESALPLLWQHNPDQPIGVVEKISEDARGLRVIARIDLENSRAAKMLKRGEVSGLSFGYRARNAHHGESGRELLDIDLFEISLVTHPLQDAARVHFVT